ncbi:hypothetical protein BEWA_017310 [Theileria equi strain WA]|uniref:Uncharacterized protein n=1 Tax=Theileria equi strain WA TaxID=1537102 RepID=L1L9G1_THEEQ|nr:hypothetical protein BEWA_017310 [Theileria equi strain WA]EKX72052.1 hypothetical protein BEWA_017310 [Theileria equi strain WA]|eukprot:XP_004831504.1 hypothetical protein BEWA_017310 [Theileria equi strain WA]
MRDVYLYASIISLAIFAVATTITIIILANKPPRVQIATMPFLVLSKRSTGETTKKPDGIDDYIWSFYVTPPEVYLERHGFEDVLSFNLGIKIQNYNSNGVSVSVVQPRYDDYESHKYQFDPSIMAYRIDFNGRPIMSFSPQRISSFTVFWEDAKIPKLVEINGEFYSINGKKCINNECCEDLENLRTNEVQNAVADRSATKK